ncbi:MAG: TonB-dependent receptor plug domain-containing protein [Crocinitomicaceae bacterium]
MKNLVAVIGVIMICAFGFAQQGDGTIMGTVYRSDSVTTKPFAEVWIDYNGSRLGTISNQDGKFKIQAVKAGLYNLHAKHSEEGKRTLSGINVYSESIAKYDIYLADRNDSLLPEIIVSSEPLLQLEHISKIRLADIQHNPNIQNPKAMLAGMNSDIKLNANNQLIIRGSRAGDVVYFVDGVKMKSMQSVPGVAINSMSVYTGGIPAKYGDTTGGIVILETKSYFDLYYAWKAANE